MLKTMENNSVRAFELLNDHRILGYSDEWTTPRCQAWHSVPKEPANASLYAPQVLWISGMDPFTPWFSHDELSITFSQRSSTQSQFWFVGTICLTQPQYWSPTYSVVWKSLSSANLYPPQNCKYSLCTICLQLNCVIQKVKLNDPIDWLTHIWSISLDNANNATDLTRFQPNRNQIKTRTSPYEGHNSIFLVAFVYPWGMQNSWS